jgi:hypothetical protein
VSSELCPLCGTPAPLTACVLWQGGVWHVDCQTEAGKAGGRTWTPGVKATAQCRHCGEVFGTGHAAATCPVARRDVANPSPHVQRHHEDLDRFYEEMDASKGIDS